MTFLLKVQYGIQYNHSQENFQEAKDLYSKLIADVEVWFNQSLSPKDHETLKALYLAVLSNASLAAYNLDQIDDCLRFSNKALGIDPGHQKCMYRKALCYMSLGDKLKPKGDIELLKKQINYYEEAKKGLQSVMRLVPDDRKIEEQLSNLVRLIVKLRRDNKLEEPKVVETKQKMKVVEEDAKETEATTKPSKNVAPKVSREFLDKITTKVMDTATSNSVFNQLNV